MRNKIIVFLSSAQHEDEFKTEREILPALFNKEPLISIFILKKIEDQAAPFTIQKQYLSLVRQSQIVILLLGSTARDAVKEEIEEAKKAGIPIYTFIRSSDEKNSEVNAYINYIRDFVTTTYYSSIKELIEKVEDSLLSIYDVKFPSKEKIDNTFNIIPSFNNIESKVIRPESEKFIFDAIVIGSWDAKSVGDKEIIEEFTRDSIDDWELKIKNIIDYESNILHFKNGIWTIVNRKKLFFKYARRFLDTDLDKIKSIALKILKERNPMFELEPKNRYVATIYGKIPKYSKNIKSGISEILALLATNENELTKCSDFKVSTIIDSIIMELFEDADWKLWASNNNLLPILAEVSPYKFMEAVEKSLRKSPSPFVELFNQTGDGISGQNYTIGLYWALEALAWSEDYISNSLLLLAELATYDTESKLVNNPKNSIERILMPWYPQTLVNFNKRLSSLNLIKKKFPDIAFKVILHLLPNQYQTSMNTYKPSYRNPVDEKWKPKITNDEYFEQNRAYAKIAIEMAKTDRKYLLILLDSIENLTNEELDDLLKYLLCDNTIEKFDEDRFPIWEKLNFTLKKHQKFNDANWAFNKETLEKIQEIVNKIKPNNPIYIYQHLFSKNDYFYFSENDNYEVYIKEIEEARALALQEIYNYGNIEAIFKFAFSVEDKYKIGLALRAIDDKKIQDNILPKYLDSTDNSKKEIVTGFIVGNFERDGEIWMDAIDFSSWDKRQICSLLLNIAYSEKIWHKASKLLGDYINNFWEKINVHPYAMRGNLTIAIDNLINYKRPLYATQIIYVYYRSNGVFLKDKAILALISGITSEENINQIDKHILLELIKLLQNDKDVEQEKLFQIEWAYFDLLDTRYGGQTTILQKYLSTKPSFLLDILKLLYRSEKETENNIQAKKNIDAIQSNARQLLDKWKNIPGTTDDNTFSESLLSDWFSSVKKLCNEEGYLERAMFYIGNVFYYAPQDVNGLWINRTVAGLLDEEEHNDLRQGYYSKAINSRGAHFVDITGSEELSIAELWKKRSQELENEGFINFAQTAKKIAISYEYEAKMNVSRYGSTND